MKHTSIEVSIAPSVFTKVTERWKEQGFITLLKMIVGYEDEEAAVKSLLNDIAEEYPDHEPLETISVCQGARMFVAAKCKVKTKKS